MLDNAKGADDNDSCEHTFGHYHHDDTINGGHPDTLNAGHPQHAASYASTEHAGYSNAEHTGYYIPSGYHGASNNGDDRCQPPCRGHGPVQRRHLQLLGHPLG